MDGGTSIGSVRFKESAPAGRARTQQNAEFTNEEQRQRARAFRDRMRALGALPPLREPRV